MCVCVGGGGRGGILDKEDRENVTIHIEYLRAYSNKKDWLARVECNCLHSSFQF